MDDHHTQPAATEFRARKRSVIVLECVVLGMTAYVLYLMLDFPIRIANPFASSRHCTLLSILVMGWAVTGMLLLMSVRRLCNSLLRRSPAIVINSDGIIAPGLGHRIVRWDEIAEIVVHGDQLIDVRPRDMSRFSSWPYKFRRLLAAVTGLPVIHMETGQLAVRINEIAAAIGQHAPADLRLGRRELLPMRPVD